MPQLHKETNWRYNNFGWLISIGPLKITKCVNFWRHRLRQRNFAALLPDRQRLAANLHSMITISTFTKHEFRSFDCTSKRCGSCLPIFVFSCQLLVGLLTHPLTESSWNQMQQTSIKGPRFKLGNSTQPPPQGRFQRDVIFASL